jgi:hypothetical protein
MGLVVDCMMLCMKIAGGEELLANPTLEKLRR